jgi:predicted RNA methylase
MYHRFSWTSVSHRRNGISAEYEPLQPYFLLALIEQAGCRTFADVGANIGAYSVLASQAASIEHLVAFEANPAAAGEVRRNLAL